MTAATLGYGCAPLMGRTSRSESVALLDTAFEAGITHFDVARLYGYGEAESAVGDFLARHRDSVTVTTKFGIDPPPATRGLRVGKAVVRRLGPLSGALRRVARRRVQERQQTGSFGVDHARASLETSLGQLRTDRVDFLLLHEADGADCTDELLAFLDDRVTAGVIGAYGIACRPDQTRAILAEHPAFAPVVQVADNVASPVLADLSGTEGRRVFTHSALGEPFQETRARLDRDDAFAREISEATGVDAGDAEGLAALFLSWARTSNPGGTVLVSSREPRRVRANAAAPLAEPSAVANLAALLRAGDSA